MDKMIRVFILLFFISSPAFAVSDINNAAKVALEFNKWYLQQIEKDIYPLLGIAMMNSMTPIFLRVHRTLGLTGRKMSLWFLPISIRFA